MITDNVKKAIFQAKTGLVLSFILVSLIWTLVAQTGLTRSSHALLSELDDTEWAMAQELTTYKAPIADASNRYLGNKDVIELGRKLFFSTKLSANGQLSCASCHQPDRNWTDGLATAEGVNEGSKNTPSLWNVAYNRWFFWDGRSDSLWSQALKPIEDKNEMNNDRLQVLQGIVETTNLNQAYIKAYGNEMSLAPRPFKRSEQSNIWFAQLGKAIAAYEFTLISPPSKFDLLIRKHLRTKDTSWLESIKQQLLDGASTSNQVIQGFQLFVGKAECVRCHFGSMYTNAEFHSIRLPGHEPGRYEGIRKLQADEFNQAGLYSDLANPPKLTYLKLVKRNYGEIKVPSLRQVSATAPYMHDGRFKTLASVIDYYSELKGAIPDSHVNETLIRPLNLTAKEKSDLLEFLMAI
ncbi:MAG: hypothetical protein COA42_23940 [Alteromonadaceae bacterium]|nr:MAG: hypothetical protein COA42_23940 [Alteromonadaceae bacterium]